MSRKGEQKKISAAAGREMVEMGFITEKILQNMIKEGKVAGAGRTSERLVMVSKSGLPGTPRVQFAGVSKDDWSDEMQKANDNFMAECEKYGQKLKTIVKIR